MRIQHVRFNKRSQTFEHNAPCAKHYRIQCHLIQDANPACRRKPTMQIRDARRISRKSLHCMHQCHKQPRKPSTTNTYEPNTRAHTSCSGALQQQTRMSDTSERINLQNLKTPRHNQSCLTPDTPRYVAHANCKHCRMQAKTAQNQPCAHSNSKPNLLQQCRCVRSAPKLDTCTHLKKL